MRLVPGSHVNVVNFVDSVPVDIIDSAVVIRMLTVCDDKMTVDTFPPIDLIYEIRGDRNKTFLTSRPFSHLSLLHHREDKKSESVWSILVEEQKRLNAKNSEMVCKK
jgi:hypothetical protein